MFDGKLYKEIARRQLKGRWGLPVIATLISIVSLFFVGNAIDRLSKLYGVNNGGIAMILLIAQICFSGIFAIANTSLYVRLSREIRSFAFEEYIHGFALYKCGVLYNLWRSIWVYLWLLLLIIPGIIKAIAYSLGWYIIVENPNISVRRALRLSIILTSGHKMEIFITMMSFIGWFILSVLSCGIGFLWLIPYYNMTMVNVFHDLKKQALASHILESSDF